MASARDMRSGQHHSSVYKGTRRSRSRSPRDKRRHDDRFSDSCRHDERREDGRAERYKRHEDVRKSYHKDGHGSHHRGNSREHRTQGMRDTHQHDDRRTTHHDKVTSDDRRATHHDKVTSDDRRTTHHDKVPSDDRRTTHHDKVPSDGRRTTHHDKVPSDDRRTTHHDKVTSDDRRTTHHDKVTSEDRRATHHDVGGSNKLERRNDYSKQKQRHRREIEEIDDEDYEFGQSSSSGADKKAEKEKPNFGVSGKLAADTNTYKGVVIKYSEPPEARKPKVRWRLYPFKGEETLPVLHIHRQSAYLIGRDRHIVDIPVDHPSCSKQHAVLQYRLVDYQKLDGSTGKATRPYLIDLESTNGTYINNDKIEPAKYYELKEKDVIKFGFSSREYVVLHEQSVTMPTSEDD